MPAEIREGVLVVTAEATPSAAISESALVVTAEAIPVGRISESVLIVNAEAPPLHRALEAVMIIVAEEFFADEEPVLVQGEELRRNYTLQGADLDNGPFWPQPD